MERTRGKISRRTVAHAKVSILFIFRSIEKASVEWVSGFKEADDGLEQWSLLLFGIRE